MAHPKEYHSSAPKHGHEHMYEILDGHHGKSVKHKGEAVKGIGGLAEVHTPSSDTRKEVFRKGGSAHKKHK